MSPGIIVALVVVALLVVAGVWFYTRRRQSDALRERFGPEYDRAVQEHGDRSKAERALQARQEQVEKLDIHALSPEQSANFGRAWHEAQTRFVDDPVAAIKEADRLVQEVMGARGYPVGDFDARAALISVDHPQVVSNYRAAHEIARRNARGEANTEDLRQAMVHYRALFEELLETEVVPGARVEKQVETQPAKEQQPRHEGAALVPDARPAAPAAPAASAERAEPAESNERKVA